MPSTRSTMNASAFLALVVEHLVVPAGLETSRQATRSSIRSPSSALYFFRRTRGFTLVLVRSSIALVPYECTSTDGPRVGCRKALPGAVIRKMPTAVCRLRSPRHQLFTPGSGNPATRPPDSAWPPDPRDLDLVLGRWPRRVRGTRGAANSRQSPSCRRKMFVTTASPPANPVSSPPSSSPIPVRRLAVRRTGSPRRRPAPPASPVRKNCT